MGRGSAACAPDGTHRVNAVWTECDGLRAGLNLSVLDPYGNMTRGEVRRVLYNLVDLMTR